MYSILATESALGGTGGILTMVIWMVIIFGAMYFFMVRPQQKEQKKGAN